ncbi:restriction endonuclease [Parapedobacter sp. GCM10030251]|uniref:restriction endonuclease n=1 Tax=Parapedobacter sp. GCM10030251 TaxID=3273419 RepID=UPI0036094133
MHKNNGNTAKGNMTWQEYQTAVSTLYDKMDLMGRLSYNVRRTDKITGQKRQIDVWWEINIGGHVINILIDAKFNKTVIDVNEIDSVASLAESVNANKAIIVTNNGYTDPALKKAAFLGMDVKILTTEEALNLTVPNKWMMCYDCNDECVVLDLDGVLFLENAGLFFNWYAGRCRRCKCLYLFCPQCGTRVILDDDTSFDCGCKHTWKIEPTNLQIKFHQSKSYIKIDEFPKAPTAFLLWLEGHSSNSPNLLDKWVLIRSDQNNDYLFRLDQNYNLLKIPILSSF